MKIVITQVQLYQDGDVVTYGGYSYVYINNTKFRETPTDNSYWDVITTGFNAQVNIHQHYYKTGDVVKYVNSYVCKNKSY